MYSVIAISAPVNSRMASRESLLKSRKIVVRGHWPTPGLSYCCLPRRGLIPGALNGVRYGDFETHAVCAAFGAFTGPQSMQVFALFGSGTAFAPQENVMQASCCTLGCVPAGHVMH